MADARGGEARGPLPLDLLERGDPAFIEAIRGVDDADALGHFAGPWFDDPRPASRALLLGYLEYPLNAYRHEGLIKRLFKRAEAAGDDRAMARFLALFDRSIRRARRKRVQYENREVESAAEAAALLEAWTGLGYLYARSYEARGRHHVYGQRFDQYIVQPRGTAMPRGRMIPDASGGTAPDWAVRFRIDWQGLGKPGLRDLPAVVEKLKGLRLFSVATRAYLRRRAWRYFRRLGRTDPDRYIAAASEALSLYRDEDVVDGLALIDNWGLTHILFHHCPTLVAKPAGWTTAEGRSLAELAPAPIFEPLWGEATGAVVGLLARARCRTVVRWAIRRIEGDPARALASYPLEAWVDLLGHDDPEIAGLAAEILRGAEGLDAIGTDRWLALVESSSPAALDVVCELAARHVGPGDVTLEQAARLAGLRPLPVARLGLSWLWAKAPRAGEADPTLLGLIEAGCVPLRSEILLVGPVDPGPLARVDPGVPGQSAPRRPPRGVGLVPGRGGGPRRRGDLAEAPRIAPRRCPVRPGVRPGGEEDPRSIGPGEVGRPRQALGGGPPERPPRVSGQALGGPADPPEAGSEPGRRAGLASPAGRGAPVGPRARASGRPCGGGRDRRAPARGRAAGPLGVSGVAFGLTGCDHAAVLDREAGPGPETSMLRRSAGVDLARALASPRPLFFSLPA